MLSPMTTTPPPSAAQCSELIEQQSARLAIWRERLRTSNAYSDHLEVQAAERALDEARESAAERARLDAERDARELAHAADIAEVEAEVAESRERLRAAYTAAVAGLVGLIDASGAHRAVIDTARERMIALDLPVIVGADRNDASGHARDALLLRGRWHVRARADYLITTAVRAVVLARFGRADAGTLGLDKWARPDVEHHVGNLLGGEVPVPPGEAPAARQPRREIAPGPVSESLVPAGGAEVPYLERQARRLLGKPSR